MSIQTLLSGGILNVAATALLFLFVAGLSGFAVILQGRELEQVLGCDRNVAVYAVALGAIGQLLPFLPTPVLKAEVLARGGATRIRAYSAVGILLGLTGGLAVATVLSLSLFDGSAAVMAVIAVIIVLPLVLVRRYPVLTTVSLRLLVAFVRLSILQFAMTRQVDFVDAAVVVASIQVGRLLGWISALGVAEAIAALTALLLDLDAFLLASMVFIDRVTYAVVGSVVLAASRRATKLQT